MISLHLNMSVLFALLLLLFVPSYVGAEAVEHARSLRAKEVTSRQTQEGRCDANWRRTRRAYNRAMRIWSGPQCYDMVFQRSCFCPPEYNEPMTVQVRDGLVVAPKSDMHIPTMDQILETIYVYCVKDCPNSGAASCSVTYGSAGNAENVNIDISQMIADEEIRYTITDFQVCK